MIIMNNILSKSGLGALAIGMAVTLSPMQAEAATITGQIDISGSLNLGSSDFSLTGNVDLNDSGTVILAFGDFANTVDVSDTVTMTDIDFTAPGNIWTVGGFTFTATSFSDITNITSKTFTALGFISGNGFDMTKGVMSFTSQDTDNLYGSISQVSFSSTTVPVPLPAGGLLLLTALGGLAAARRKRKAA